MNTMNRKSIIYGVIILTVSFSPAWAQFNSGPGYQFGIASGLFNLSSDNVPSESGLCSELFFQRPFKGNMSFLLSAGFASQTFGTVDTKYETDFIKGELGVRYYINPHNKIAPFLYGGLGALNFSTMNSDRYWDGAAILGGGISVGLTPFINLDFSGAYNFTSGDDFDGVNDGSPDNFVSAKAGLSFALQRNILADQSSSVVEYANLDLEPQEIEVTENLDDGFRPIAPMIRESNYSIYEKKKLKSRIAQVENQMKVYDEMKKVLLNAIKNRDSMIQNLESSLAQRTN
jgi:hypothetical protein